MAGHRAREYDTTYEFFAFGETADSEVRTLAPIRLFRTSEAQEEIRLAEGTWTNDLPRSFRADYYNSSSTEESNDPKPTRLIPFTFPHCPEI